MRFKTAADGPLPTLCPAFHGQSPTKVVCRPTLNVAGAIPFVGSQYETSTTFLQHRLCCAGILSGCDAQVRYRRFVIDSLRFAYLLWRLAWVLVHVVILSWRDGHSQRPRGSVASPHAR